MKNSKKIIVVGANGRMGSLVCKKLQENDFEVIEIDKNNDLNSTKNANLIIDFANSKSSIESANFAVKNNIPLIIGSTGQTEGELKLISSFKKHIPIMICPNFSIGISKLKQILPNVLKLKIDSITIFECHHKNKTDRPSGTAILLKKEIEKYYNGNIEILSSRGGMETGTHIISFYFGSEKISISHHAFSRDAFADGVTLATKSIFNKSPGLYNLENFVHNEQIN